MSTSGPQYFLPATIMHKHTDGKTQDMSWSTGSLVTVFFIVLVLVLKVTISIVVLCLLS